MQYRVIPLKLLLDSWSDTDITATLSTFHCSRDADIEDFLKNKAVTFEKMDRSRTYLFVSGQIVAGYVSLAMTVLDISEISGVSKNLRKKLHLDNGTSPAFLIGQLGKDDSVMDKLGVKMIDFAKTMFSKSREVSGGRIICVDCKKQLLTYYKSIGFKLVHEDLETGLYRMIWLY